LSCSPVGGRTISEKSGEKTGLGLGLGLEPEGEPLPDEFYSF
jgi:hypothetical protein